MAAVAAVAMERRDTRDENAFIVVVWLWIMWRCEGDFFVVQVVPQIPSLYRMGLEVIEVVRKPLGLSRGTSQSHFWLNFLHSSCLQPLRALIPHNVGHPRHREIHRTKCFSSSEVLCSEIDATGVFFTDTLRARFMASDVFLHRRKAVISYTFGEHPRLSSNFSSILRCWIRYNVEWYFMSPDNGQL